MGGPVSFIRIIHGTYFIYAYFLFVAASLDTVRPEGDKSRAWFRYSSWVTPPIKARATADWNRSLRVPPFAPMTTVRTAEKRRLEGNRIRNPFPWTCLRASAVGEERATFWQKAGAMIELQHGSRFVVSIEHRFTSVYAVLTAHCFNLHSRDSQIFLTLMANDIDRLCIFFGEYPTAPI